MSVLKGCVIAIFLFFLGVGVYAQGTKTPLVVSANEVPVLGGRLDIVGINFGSDPTVINVYIHNRNAVTQCVDVQIVTPNTAISCSIIDIGTGTPKHIEVVVNGLSNDAGSEDGNVAFRRSAPQLEKLVYDTDEDVIRIYGRHFGLNPSVVSVILEGYAHRVLAVKDSEITCKQHAQHHIYSGQMPVYVDVDSQSANTSMTMLLETVEEDIGENIDASSEETKYQSTLLKYRIILSSFIAAAAGVALLTTYLVLRKRKTPSPITTSIATVEQAPKSDNNNAIVIVTTKAMVRDTSFEEIDLNSDKTTQVTQQDAQPAGQQDDVYELQRSDSASSYSSFSSTYSSTNCTPTSYTPNASSPNLDADLNNKRSSKREKIVSSMCALDEPISRLGKQSMDSPYFAKQNAFDSPLATSQELSPNMTPSCTALEEYDSPHGHHTNPLQSSQEINQLRSNPFDSPSVLHTAIQRAAMLRAAQQPQPSQQSTQPSMIMQGRRASLGTGHQKHGGNRRSSLSTVSLHVSALHNAAGKYAERQPKKQKKQRLLRATQYMHQVDDILVEGDE